MEQIQTLFMHYLNTKKVMWTYLFFQFGPFCWYRVIYTSVHNQVLYRQPNKLMAYLTFHKWLVSVCNINNHIMNSTNQNQPLGKSELRYYLIRLTISFLVSLILSFTYLIGHRVVKIHNICLVSVNKLVQSSIKMITS